MSRGSRKDRKSQRERVARAADRGLPTSPLEKRREQRAALSPRATAGTNESVPQAAAATSDGKGAGGWFSTLPPSFKVFGLATLALLAFGLWQTLRVRHGP